jgi:hypothetical protein
MPDLQKIQSSLITLKAMIQAGLNEVEKIEKELADVKKPSKRALNYQQEVDKIYIKKREAILRNHSGTN